MRRALFDQKTQARGRALISAVVCDPLRAKGRRVRTSALRPALGRRRSLCAVPAVSVSAAKMAVPRSFFPTKTFPVFRASFRLVPRLHKACRPVSRPARPYKEPSRPNLRKKSIMIHSNSNRYPFQRSRPPRRRPRYPSLDPLSSMQAPYPSLPRKRESSLAPLHLLFRQNLTVLPEMTIPAGFPRAISSLGAGIQLSARVAISEREYPASNRPCL